MVDPSHKRRETVGELGRADNCVSDVAFLQAHDAGNTYAERLAWEGENRFANSIRPFYETYFVAGAKFEPPESQRIGMFELLSRALCRSILLFTPSP
jgi:hypothetical protein